MVPIVEEYIELLRTEWADHIFVFAGGADPCVKVDYLFFCEK